MTASALPDICTVTIERLVAGGNGLALVEQMPVFVPFTAPGDVVTVRIVERHAQYARAEIIAVLTPSAERTIPQCPVFGACGGCQWQHLRYEAQLAWKQRIVEEQLRRIAKIPAPCVLPTIAAPQPWHYRSRIKLQLDNVGHIGFFRAGSYDIVEFEHCFIADARINAHLAANKAKLRRTGRGRELRVDTAEGFAQVNPAQNQQLQRLVAEGVAARAGGRVLELYCGNGNLTFAIASVAREIIGVESHGPLAKMATHAATEKKVRHVQIRCTAADRYLRHANASHEIFDGVILDPPRRGADEAMAGIVRLQPRWIGYVSCDPATLARDVATLLAGGYAHEATQPLDMFPQTFHIESITWMRRNAT